MLAKPKKKPRSKVKDTSSQFMKFLLTLPGILTAIAALLTAIAGLYVAFAPPKAGSGNTVQPTPVVVSSQKKDNAATSSPEAGNCLEAEFGDVEPVEVSSGTQPLKVKEGEIKIKLTDNYQTIGALSLKFHQTGEGHFEIKKVLDAKCAEVTEFFNVTRSTYIDKNIKVPNYDTLHISFSGQKYSIRLLHDTNGFSATFGKL
jgi:hypothetical protein